MVAPKDGIIGPAVTEQTTLRPAPAAADLDEFIEFLAQIEALFGPVDRPRDVAGGDCFLL